MDTFSKFFYLVSVDIWKINYISFVEKILMNKSFLMLLSFLLLVFDFVFHYEQFELRTQLYMYIHTYVYF